MIHLPPELVIARAAELRDVLEPLARELGDCYWLVETQSGPFRDYFLPGKESVYDALMIDTEVCRDTSCSTWRPGTLPEHADPFVVDEWTYLFAICCEESELAARAEWLVPHIGRFGAEFFTGFEAVADLFVMHVDGWWELYTPHPEWHRRLRLAFPESLERSVAELGKPPREAA